MFLTMKGIKKLLDFEDSDEKLDFDMKITSARFHSKTTVFRYLFRS